MDAQQNVPAQPEEVSVEGFNRQRERSNRIYFHVFDNSLCRKSKQPVDAPGWEGPIITTNPENKQEVSTWIERFDSLVCRIANVERRSMEFEGGRKINLFEITLIAGNQQAVLSLKWIDHVLKRFLKVARNIDFTKPLRISVFESVNRTTGKRGTAVSFKQGDGPDPEQWPKIDEYWGLNRTAISRNENPAEAAAEIASLLAQGYMPDAVHDDFNDSWDYTAQNKFLGMDFVKNLMPGIQQLAKEVYGIQDKAVQEPAQQGAAGQGATDNRSNLQQARQNFNTQQAQQPLAPPAPVAPVMPQVTSAPPPPMVPVAPPAPVQVAPIAPVVRPQAPDDDGSFFDDIPNVPKAPPVSAGPNDDIPF